MLSVTQIERLSDILHFSYDLSKLEQFTFECSPYTTDIAKLDILKKIGVNRVTFGVQSLDDDILRNYNRPQEKIETFHMIYEAKKRFPFVNIDIIA
jgi:oxygen-independent coproporphyrinogen-3 oxidase